MKNDKLGNSIENNHYVDYKEEEEPNSNKFNESTDFVFNEDGTYGEDEKKHQKR